MDTVRPIAKNLVFLIRNLEYGGAPRQFTNLAIRLSRQGFTVTVCYFYPGGPLEREFADTAIQTICLDKRGRWDVLHCSLKLLQHLRRLCPEVLYSYGTANIFAIFLKPFLPTTRIAWRIGSANIDPREQDWLAKLLGRVANAFSRHADVIIVNSYAGYADCAARGFPVGKMAVIPSGIDIERFAPDPEAGASVRAAWRIPAEAIVIGLVGRLVPRKDHPTFLKATARLCAERQDVYVVCIGKGPGPYAKELSRLAAQLGIAERVRWAGPRADMPAVYNALTVAVSASASGEGCSNAIGEAMACGIPCIVTDVGDSARIVGETGLVVPPRDPFALHAALKRLIAGMESHGFDRNSTRRRIVHMLSLDQVVVQTAAALFGTDFIASRGSAGAFPHNVEGEAGWKSCSRGQCDTGRVCAHPW